MSIIMLDCETIHTEKKQDYSCFSEKGILKSACALTRKNPMATIQTVRTGASVEDFIATVANATRQQDARTLVAMMETVTGEPAAMWGPAIIGFGEVTTQYANSSEGRMLRMGFSPRKANLALYIGHDKSLLARLGKHKTSVACLYINKLADIDLEVLRKLIARSWNRR
jgi:hypothetical protein